MNGALSCNASHCIHNINGLCLASNITVKGFSAQGAADTLCSTFAEKNFKNAFAALSNNNLSGEVKQIFNVNSISMYPKVSCNATRCKYNQNMLCQAEGLVISGSGAISPEGTYCSSFKA